MQKKSQEDYLEAILIQINKVGACRVTDIARQIGFTKASTSVALKKLEEEGLVIRDDWRVLLTDKGYTTAKATYEKHLFFVEWLDKLGIEKRVAEEEAYINKNYGGKIYAAYGCSLGGSFVALLINRQKIHITHGIIGSSDMDQMPKWLAKVVTAVLAPVIYPLITGKGGFVKKLVDRKTERHPEDAEYRQKFMDMMGMGKMNLSFISIESVKNQFCTDLYTPVGKNIDVPGTTIHVFYAKKMGNKYLTRYKKYFAKTDIIEFDLQHEELLLDAERFVAEVTRVCMEE